MNQPRTILVEVTDENGNAMYFKASSLEVNHDFSKKFLGPAMEMERIEDKSTTVEIESKQNLDDALTNYD
jgi:hypothetical protein